MTAPRTDSDAVARASRLIGLFCLRPGDFGELRAVGPSDMPAAYRDLLDHESHMTVAMERLQGAPVGLQVVASAGEPATTAGGRGWYAREILLLSVDRVVQYGIVRIDLDQVDAATAATILAAKIPLGRILIEANLLRNVHDVQLLEVEPGPKLRTLFGNTATHTADVGRTFGRVAEISLIGRPAVELLEIAASGLLPKALR